MKKAIYAVILVLLLTGILIAEPGQVPPKGMVFVEGGTFQMGSTSGKDREKPVHRVTVSDFYIGKYEVTQGEYEAVMGTNPSEFKKSGKDAPVEEVSWVEAAEYCNKLSDREGLDRCYSGSGSNITWYFNANGYRLPTEAEWEFTALGGNKNKGYKYSGSNDLGSVAWYRDNSGKTHSVGEKQANELGIYDMSGNVWEWCWDWYGDYSESAQTDPHGPASGSDRVRRGGGWSGDASCCRADYRARYNPARYTGGTINSLGFRLVRSSKLKITQSEEANFTYTDDQGLVWQKNLDRAKKLANKENKSILIRFSGSDWTPFYHKMNNEIFYQQEFEKFAKENLILVRFDFPRNTKLPADEENYNKQMVEKFGLKGLPTLILTDSSGNVIQKHNGYIKGGAIPYVATLQDLIK